MRYKVIWELADGLTQGETEPMGLEECLTVFPGKARELAKAGGFNWIQIEPA